MSSLADDLLADLDDLSDGGEAGNEAQHAETQDSHKRKRSDDEMSEDEETGGEEVGGLVLEGGVKPAEELDIEDVQRMELADIEDVRSIAKLVGSRRMEDILKVRFRLCCRDILPHD